MKNEEMKAQELRIGNIVSHDDYSGETFEVISIERYEDDYVINTKGGKNGTWINPISIVNPVNITKDLLFELGFEYNQYTGLWDVEGVSFDTEHSNFYHTDSNDYPPEESNELIKVKYVHHLQNLYFDLMGKELILEKTYAA